MATNSQQNKFQIQSLDQQLLQWMCFYKPANQVQPLASESQLIRTHSSKHVSEFQPINNSLYPQ